MPAIGLLIEFKDDEVKPVNIGLATIAQAEGHEIVALVVDASARSVKHALEAFGIHRIVNIQTGGSGWNPVCQTGAILAAMEKFNIKSLIGLTTPLGREVLPRIAARLDAPLVMDCIDIDLDAHRVRTSQYSGKAIATITLTGSHFIYGLRPNVIQPVQKPETAEIVDFSYHESPPAGYRVIGSRTSDSGSQNLAEADIIISGGRGMKNGENFNLLFDCARHMNAAVGASRVAVDNGWVPYAMQVGQTGAKVNPKVYIAAGISGSIQHFAGMKTAGLIIAINTDKDAAIMANCDYYAVGDLFAILAELEKALAAV